MTDAQAGTVLDLLNCAFPTKSREERQGAMKLYRQLIAEWDYDLAAAAARSIIESEVFFPKFALVRRHYQGHCADARQTRERDELAALEAEPTDAEKAQWLEYAQHYLEHQWGTA